MNIIVKNVLLSFALLQSPIIVCNAQMADVQKQVVEDAEYKRTLEQMKKAHATVEELYDDLADVQRELFDIDAELSTSVKYGGGPISKRANDLFGRLYDLREERKALIEEIKHALVMAELTTKIFNKEVLRIEAAQ